MTSCFFTQAEQDVLIANGWDISADNRTADKNWRRIKKRGDNEFEGAQCMTDEPDGNDYWEFDDELVSLEKAVRRA